MSLKETVYKYVAQHFAAKTFTANDVVGIECEEHGVARVLHSMCNSEHVLKVVAKVPSKVCANGRWLNVYQVIDLETIKSYRPHASKRLIGEAKTNTQTECANRLFAAMNWGTKHAQKMPSPRS